MVARFVPSSYCPMCGNPHSMCDPHNLASPLYLANFYNCFGYWPRWIDAMSHCSEGTISYWCDSLISQGIDVLDHRNPTMERVGKDDEKGGERI